MPRNSERQRTIKSLQANWKSLILLDFVADIQLAEFEDDVLDALVDVFSNRYLSTRTWIPKPPQRFGWFLDHMDDRMFKQRFRLNRDSFARLLGLIEGHIVFQRKPRKEKQAPVHVQLLVALSQLGTCGT